MNVLQAKLTDWAFESNNAIQYVKDEIVNIIYDERDRQSFKDVNLADKHQRKLVEGKTLGGRWVFMFDRANASDTNARIWFCKDCGEPFYKLSEIGTHTRSKHNPTDKLMNKTKQENDDEEEERLLAAKIAEEAAEDSRAAGA